MKTLHGIASVALIAGLMLAAGCQSSGVPRLGSPAPQLTIAEWVKGRPVNLEDGRGKNIYVVEFWATWCGPCRASIPHITEMQKKFKGDGVIFVGISDEQKDLDKVKSFVKDMGDKMDYVVAVDDGRQTFNAYMKAYKQGGIPHAFLIDKRGRIVWHDHPMRIEESVAELVAGDFDLAAARKTEKQRQKAQAAREQTAELYKEYFELVSAPGNAGKARKVGEKLLKVAGEDASVLNAFAWNILTGEKVQDRDLKLAMRAAQAAYDACDGANAAVVDTYARAHYEMGNVDEAIKYQRKAIELCENAQMMADLEKTLAGYLEKQGGGSD